MVCVVAPLIAEILTAVDMLITAEVKGIPFVHELSRHMDMPRYILARKSIKAYMENPLISKVNSITTGGRTISLFRQFRQFRR